MKTNKIFLALTLKGLITLPLLHGQVSQQANPENNDPPVSNNLREEEPLEESSNIGNNYPEESNNQGIPVSSTGSSATNVSVQYVSSSLLLSYGYAPGAIQAGPLANIFALQQLSSSSQAIEEGEGASQQSEEEFVETVTEEQIINNGESNPFNDRVEQVAQQAGFEDNPTMQNYILNISREVENNSALNEGEKRIALEDLLKTNLGDERAREIAEGVYPIERAGEVEEGAIQI